MNSLSIMKLLVFISVIALSSAQSETVTATLEECVTVCKDKRWWCSLDYISSFCTHETIGPTLHNVCGYTCNTCNLCDAVSARSTCNIENDPCRDEDPNLCAALHIGFCSVQGIGFIIGQNKCRRKCGMCTPCKPIQARSLTPCYMCKDLQHQCEHWAKYENYCSSPIHRSWMTQRCPLSCGVCQPCKAETQNPNIAPPTRPSTRPTLPPQSATAGPVATANTEIASFGQVVDFGLTTQEPKTSPSRGVPLPNLSDEQCRNICMNGSCDGEKESRRGCECNRSGFRKEYPLCRGTAANRCVARCDRPEGFLGDWTLSCTGVSVCTCTEKGNIKSGIKPGALCQ